MEEKKLLQLGDKICEDAFGYKTIVEINKVTKKYAFCGAKKFHREYEGGLIRYFKKLNGLSFKHYTIATENDFKAIEEREEKEKLISQIQSMSLWRLNLEELNELKDKISLR